MRNLLLALCLLPAISASGSDLWAIGYCTSQHAAERARLTERILNASPDDPLYLPHPFPRNADEAVADFVHAHRKTITRSGRTMREDDARLFRTVDAGKARFLVSRVANWTPTRCDPRLGQNDFYYLIRVFDKTTGKEITRATTSESGRVHSLMHRPDDEEQAASSMSALSRLVVTESLPAPQKPQFVRTWGPKLRCDVLDPCIAFQSGGRTYLSKNGTVYRLKTEEPISFTASLGMADARAAFLQRLEGRPETVVSVGGDQMTIAVPVSDP